MGTTSADVETEQLDEILNRYDSFDGNLIAILHDVQGLYNYLPELALEYVSDRTGFSLQRIFSIATFYNYFSLERRGRHLIHVCTGTACHVQGAQRVLDEFKHQLDVDEGGTTGDMEFTLAAVRCVGACSLAPVVLVDKQAHAALKPAKVSNLLKKLRK
jgi:NADH:ubiquinone oxidoreductase subunit E